MRKTLLVGLAVTGAALAGSGVLVYLTLFAPEGAQAVDEAFPDLGHGSTGPNGTAPMEPAPLRSGAFQGADGFHYASGTVSLYQGVDGAFVLRFEDYDARDGPDVYLYLTRNAGDSSTQAVERDGLRVLVPGGEGDGRATLRGTFNVELPAGTDALAYGGITIWCDDFNAFFGHAPLG